MNRMFNPYSNAPKFQYYIQMSHKDMNFGYCIVYLTEHEAKTMLELGQTYFAGKVVMIESVRKLTESENSEDKE